MKRSVVLFVLALAVASLAVAGTTGRLIGTVRDDKGQPLPGATVTISSPTQIGGAQVEVSDADGNFSFPTLAPGYFTVKIELSGFVAQERNEVQVRLDRATELNVTMPLGKFADEVTVVAETPVVDPTQVSTSQTFTPDFLKGVAVTSGRRGYQNVLDMAPGVVDDGGNPHVYGSSLGENVFLIDGLNTTDPVTATFGTNFTFDAIQEISFQTGGYEAEYGQAIGGVVNVVTKSGGNDFSGTLDTRYSSTSFYQNADHFKRDENKAKLLIPGVTLGGPILRDKLWFFAAYQHNDTLDTPTLSPTGRKFVADYYMGKLTWQANPSWRLTGKYTADPAKIDNEDASYLVAPDATTYQKQGGHIFQADASGVLSSNLLLNLGVGVTRSPLDAYPESRDFTTVGHYNYITAQSYGNAQNAQYSKRDRNEFKGSLTWFVENLLGSHEFKLGAEHDKLYFWTHNYTPAGGFAYNDVTEGYWYGGDSLTPIPYVMFQTPDPGGASDDGKMETGYLQDAWKIRSNVTLKLGVRYDQASFSNDAGAEIAKIDKWQPRVGLAWDVAGDAKNVVKASWGRFMHPSATTLPWYTNTHLSTTTQWISCSTVRGFTTAQQCMDYVAARAGYSYTAGPADHFDPLGWYTRGARDVFGSSPSHVNPNLKPAYADELILGFQRELFNKTSVEVSFVDKKTKDIIDDTCQGNLIGETTDTGDPSYCSYYVVANLSGLKRDYRGATLKFETRATDWMSLLASYTYSTSKGNIEYTQGGSTGFDFCPEHCENRYGYLSDDRRHRVKLNGSLKLPAHLTLGVDSFWSSPFDYSKTESGAVSNYGTHYIDPRGAFRASSNYQLDLSLSYKLKLGPINAELIGSVLNVFNSEQVIGVCENNDGCGIATGTYDWSQPDAWQTPRRFEAGFRIEF